MRYNSEEFVNAASSDFQPFLRELVSTQQFDDFISRRMYNAADAPDTDGAGDAVASRVASQPAEADSDSDEEIAKLRKKLKLAEERKESGKKTLKEKKKAKKARTIESDDE